MCERGRANVSVPKFIETESVEITKRESDIVCDREIIRKAEKIYIACAYAGSVVKRDQNVHRTRFYMIKNVRDLQLDNGYVDVSVP